jgi:hypothetical protein
MAWILVPVGLLVVVAVIAIAIGSALPREHVATVRIRLAATPTAVWAILDDPLAAATWRKDLKSVDALPDVGGHRSWREITSSETITYVLDESTPLQSRTTRIADENLPFGGRWEFSLSAEGAGTVVTVTERGFVSPALFRFMARYVFGYTKTLEDYLSALAAHLNEKATPEVVASGH